MLSVASFLFIFVGDCPAVLCSGRTISRVSALVFPHPHQHSALSLFFSHPDRYTAIPHCGFSLHFPNSLVVKGHASVFMWQHGSGLAGHKSPGWLMVGWRNEDGRATWPLGSRHAAGRLGDRASSGRGGAPRAFGGLFSERAQLHIPCPVIPARLKASPGSRSGRADPVHLSMGEAVRSGVKGFGRRQGQRLGGRFAVIIAHQVSRIFHPFFFHL